MATENTYKRWESFEQNQKTKKSIKEKISIEKIRMVKKTTTL